MRRIFISWLIIALTLILLANFLPGISVESLPTALWAGVIIGLINLTIRPLVRLITLPLNWLTLGLFALVVNALMFWLAAGLVPGFEVAGFLSAFLGSLLMSLVFTAVDRWTEAAG